MKHVAKIQGWYLSVLDRRRAQHVRQPLYPFAGAIGVLRRTVKRLGHSTPAVVKAYCDGLPPNVFCRVNERSIIWWILGKDMIWMAQVDRSNMDMAFAACADFDVEHALGSQKVREVVRPLYAPLKVKSIDWEDRLQELSRLSASWMRVNRSGLCLPGLVVPGKEGQAKPADPLGYDPIRRARRLEKPKRLDVAVPLILHGLWTELRQENMTRVGGVADAWQLACALVDNPWESWQTVCSGRLA